MECMKTNVSEIILELENLKEKHGDVHVRLGVRGEPVWKVSERPIKHWVNAFTCESKTEIEIVGSWSVANPNLWARIRIFICGLIYPKYINL